MKNFKPGQKVVFKGEFKLSHPYLVSPKQKEIVTILKAALFPNAWVVKEYQYALNGTEQCISSTLLFPIEERAITIAVHKIKLEPKKVLEHETLYAQ